MSIETLFSAVDLEEIRAATAAAERKSSGEIVPYLVGRIDGYDEARWRAATLGALALTSIAGMLHQFGGLWGGAGVLWITLPALVGAGLGVLLAERPWIRRRLLTEGDFAARVRLRAEAAFLEEEVFATRDRTGILLFLAVFEQRALVLADAGIHRQVPPGTWQRLVDEMVSGIRAGRATKAVCAAIDRCGDILAEHELERRADDANELRDSLRIRAR